MAAPAPKRKLAPYGLPCVLLLGFAAAAPAGEASRPEPYEGRLSTGPRIAEIRVEPLPVFDPRIPGEDRWVFRMANAIHFTTRRHVVRRELLLAPGEAFDPGKALESERGLRANGAFRFVSVSSAARADGRTELLALTRDSWTTILRAFGGTEGGERFFIYGGEENNLLGLNKQASYYHSRIGPRTRDDLRYTDPRLAGSRYRLSTLYAPASRGDSFGADLARPFFSLDSAYALGGGWTRLIDEEILYQDGRERSRFISRSRSAQLSCGRRLEGDDWFVRRVEAGWHAEKRRFAALSGTFPLGLPADRELSGPVLGYSWVQPRYIQETNVDGIANVEDFNMGSELRLFGGYMGRFAGADRDRTIFDLAVQQGYRWAPGRFALAQAGLSGREAGGDWDNALAFANANLVWKTRRALESTWVGHAELAVGRALDGENQILLGGDNGLRGYRNNSFAGAKSVLFNLENRFVFPGEYLHLMRFGGAVFVDSGAVLPEGGAFSLKRFNSDVGFGLRIASTRSRSGGVFRVDLAYALDRGPVGGRFVLGVRGGQAFDFFNSSARRVRRSPASRLNALSPPGFPALR